MDLGVRAGRRRGRRLDRQPVDHAAQGGESEPHVSLGHGPANAPRSEDRSATIGPCCAWRWASCSSGRWRMLVQLNIDQFAFEGSAAQADASLAAAGRADRRRRPRQRAGRRLVRRQSRARHPAARRRRTGLVCVPAVHRRRRVGRSQRASYTLSYFAACVFLLLLGVSAGLFDVPLAAFMQDRSPPEHRGSILAASNFLTFGGMLIASVVYWLLRAAGRSASNFHSATNLPALRPRHRARVHLHRRADPAGDDQVPRLAADALVLPHPRLPAREHPGARRRDPGAEPHLLARRPVAVRHLVAPGAHAHRRRTSSPTGGPAASAKIDGRHSDQAARPKPTRQRHRNGPRSAARPASSSASFPKAASAAPASCSRSSRACSKSQRGTGAPIIPVYLDELWGSIFSFRGGKFFWKWPSAHAAPRLDLVRQADRRSARHLTSAAGRAGPRRRRRRRPQAAHRRPAPRDDPQLPQGDVPLEDRRLDRHGVHRRQAADADARPAPAAAAPCARRRTKSTSASCCRRRSAACIANAALSMAGRVTANLNYTASPEVLNACIAQGRHPPHPHQPQGDGEAGHREVQRQLDAEFVFLEDLRDKVTARRQARRRRSARIVAPGLVARPHARPAPNQRRRRAHGHLHLRLDRHAQGRDAHAPQHRHERRSRSSRSSIRARTTSSSASCRSSIRWASRSRCGGRCCSTSAPRTTSRRSTPQQIGQARREVRTPRSCSPRPRSCASTCERCEPEDFKPLEVVVAGAEKLPIPLCDAFEQKFGVRPVEGYGTTELSPLVSVNVPPSRSQSRRSRLQGRLGRPARARRLGEDRRPRNVRRPAARHARHAAGERPERDEGLPRPARRNGQGDARRLVHHRRHRHDRQATASSTSPAGSAASRKSAARWCRTSASKKRSRNPRRRARTASCSVVVTAVPDERKGERLVVVHTKLDDDAGGNLRATSASSACRTSGSPAPTASSKSKRSPSSAAARSTSKP